MRDPLPDETRLVLPSRSINQEMRIAVQMPIGVQSGDGNPTPFRYNTPDGPA
jgi:hypothetical protein